ncbi:MAG: ABC transporter permease subunit [Bacillota bacterium]|nr:ABC transporter permease subunit [Bacillota bacterium]
MNIFYRELRANRRSLILWCLGMIFLILAGMAKFSAYKGAGQSVQQLMNSMPKSIQVLLGTYNFDVTTAKGFYGVLFLYIILLAAIHAAMLGASIISKEERDRTFEFLYVRPVTRNKIITAKLVASAINVFILWIVTYAVSLAYISKIAPNENAGNYLSTLMFGMLCTQVLFLTVGMMLSAVCKKYKAAPGMSSFLVFLTFFMSYAADLNGKLDFLKYFTPFQYFNAVRLLNNGISLLFTAITFILIIISVFITYIAQQKRDLKV